MNDMGILLPAGWREHGDILGRPIIGHEQFGWITIDFESRIAAAGATVPRISNALVGPSYNGRGWRKRLVKDAIDAAIEQTGEQ